MTHEDMVFAACFLSVTVLLFGALYARDIMRVRFRKGKPRVPGCLSAPLQAGMCFLAAFLLVLIPKLIRPPTRWGWWGWSLLLQFSGTLFAVGAMFLCGFGVAALFRWNAFFRSVKEDEQTAILDELALCMERGLPVDGLLDAFATERRSQILYYARAAAKRLREGAPLSAALAARTMLPPHAIASIQAGELSGGGTLPAILRRISSEFRADREQRTSMKIGLAYAAFLILMIVPILRFEWIYIVPKITTILTFQPKVPPLAPWWSSLTTVMDIGLSGLVVVLLLLILTMEGVQRPTLGDRPTRIAARLRALRREICDCIPLVRRRMRHECLARSAGVMSALVSAKVPLQDAARGASHPDIAGPYSKNLLLLAHAIDEGRPVREALQLSKLPAAFAIFFQAGENAADLDKALQLAADFQQAKKARVDRLLALLVPLILLPAIGAIVGASYIGTLKALSEIQRGLMR